MSDKESFEQIMKVQKENNGHNVRIANLDVLFSNTVNSAVVQYFSNMLKNVTFDGESFSTALIRGYLNHRCYAGSMISILPMQDSDQLVRGTLHSGEKHDYNHGWIEFTFDNQRYVYDTTAKRIFDRDHYYNILCPINIMRKTNEEVKSICLGTPTLRPYEQSGSTVDFHIEQFPNIEEHFIFAPLLSGDITAIKENGIYKVISFDAKTSKK